MSHSVSVKPWGPNHRRSRSGWVYAANTARRGASNARSTTMSRSPGAVTRTGLRSVTVAGDLTELGEQVVEPLERTLPERAVLREPLRRLGEWATLQVAGAALRVPPSRHQPSPLQHLEVLGDRRLRHRERLAE